MTRPVSVSYTHLACEHFEQDNDVEECYDETENACYN